MKLRILRLDSLAMLKDKCCIEKCRNMYKNYPSNDWLDEICGESPFIDTKYKDIPDIDFDMSAPKGKEFETEFANVKKTYSTLSFLSDSQASEERLWAALSLDIGYQYVQYRWNLETVNSISQHVFFENGSRRSLTRNALSRLWWIGRLTYDKDRRDPYELTRFVCSHSDYIMHFIERNTSNNLHILRPFLEAIIEALEKGYDLNTNDAGALSKYLNLLGGMYILDFMSEDWIKDKMAAKIEQLINTSVLHADDMTNDGTKKKVDSSSRIILEANNAGTRLMISAKKNKFRTIPKSLLDLQVNDKVRIGKITYHIVDIK